MNLRKIPKIPLMLHGGIARTRRPGIFFLIYHRVGDSSSLEMDIPLPLFRKQMECLAETGAVISYEDAVRRLLSGEDIDRDLYVITFDDGFEDFYCAAFPVLRSLGLPCMLFVTTGFVDEGIPYPLSVPSRLPVHPVSWDMLGEMHESGLVAIGSHTHSHLVLPRESAETVEKDLVRCRSLFMDKLGIVPRHFAYPKASWSRQAESIVREHYDTAVIGGGAKALSAGFAPLRIPRVPVRRSDGWFFFLAKIRGYLSTEEKFYETCRRFRQLRSWELDY